MCLICAELTKNKLSSVEARRNLGEMSSTLKKDHILEILKLIWQKEDEEYESMWDNENMWDTGSD